MMETSVTMCNKCMLDVHMEYERSTYNEDSETDEPITKDHQETLVGSLEVGVSGDHDHNTPSPGSRVDADVAGLGKDCCKNGEDDPDAELSKEYLKMGRGFCLEEDEDNKEPGISGCSPPTKGLNEVDRRGELKALTSPDAAAGTAVAVSARSDKEDDVEIRPVNYLSAMPNLRRKRKKILTVFYQGWSIS